MSQQRKPEDAAASPGYENLRPTHKAMTKAEAAYLGIRKAILDGRLAPGMRIDQEELARAFGCSITPIREALRWLGSEDLVIVPAHREVIVAPLSLQELTDIYNVRLLLDPFAASLGARNASAETRERVMTLAEQRCGESRHDRMSHNREFHQAIYGASGNTVLNAQLDSLWDRSGRYRLTVLDTEQRAMDAREEHLEIGRAFYASNYATIARLMHDHIATSFDRIMNMVPNDEALGSALESDVYLG